MGQMILTTSNMQMARANCQNELERMDRILFPNAEKTLSDHNMSADEVEEAITSFLELQFHQGTISGNLEKFTTTFAKGAFALRPTDTVRRKIITIASHEAALRQNITAMYGGGRNAQRIVSLMINILAFASVSLVFSIASAARVLAAAEHTTATNTETGGGPGLIAIVLLATAGICGGGYYYGKKKKGSDKRSIPASTVSAKLNIEKAEALKVLDLLVAISAIYRVCEQAGK